MDICTFNDHYLNPFRKTFERKFLIGDFNIDLLKFDSFEHVNKFINDLSSNYLHPQIQTQISISHHTKPLSVGKSDCSLNVNRPVICESVVVNSSKHAHK